MKTFFTVIAIFIANLSFANINQDIDDCRQNGGECVVDILQKLSMNTEVSEVSSCAAFDNRPTGKVECCQIECHNSKRAVCRDSVYTNNPQVCKLANCSCESRR